MRMEDQYLALIEEGLPPPGTPKKVVVVGAGMAGLVSAWELRRAGYEVVILEARGRVGGRIETVREPFSNGLWAEAGAMRIPRSHRLTMAYVDRFKLPISPFMMGNQEAYYHIAGQRCRMKDARINPAMLGFEVAEHERGRTSSELWADALRPIKARLDEKGEDAWPDIIAEYDQYSTRAFLQLNGWSDGMIEMFGLLENQESRMNASFVALLLADPGEVFNNMIQIDGGMDGLPIAFTSELNSAIRFGANMVAVEQKDQKVTIHYVTQAGRMAETADFAIITVPFSVLRHTEILQPFSRGKQRAVRQIRYDASAKIWFQCRRRFWEEDDGIVGGGSVTDLAGRNVYYSEHGRETGRGILLASYTWADDAQRWGSLSPDDRILQALENVAHIHPQVLQEFEVGASKMCHDDPFACGAFALFEPGQQTSLHDAMLAVEGRVHFAGEHTSTSHRWIQGAVESGLRAAEEICERVAG